MPFENRFDKKWGTVFVSVRGEITVEDLMRNEAEVLNHPDYRRNYNMLLDLADATAHHSVDLGKVEMSKDFVASIQDAAGRCRWAVHAPDDYTYAFASMFAIISGDLSVETRVFRDRSEALAWLGVQ